MASSLTTNDHSRDAAGLKYVYPVLSRRAGGLSVGVNFNTNNACNWRCLYCQVPDLVKGSAPKLDLVRLERELTDFLKQVTSGEFYRSFQVPESQRVIKDIAISGNGEPTSSGQFAEALRVIFEASARAQIKESFDYVLITNGSLIHQQHVSQGLSLLQQAGGQVWYKLDSATDAGRKRINNAGISGRRVEDNLLRSAELCPTWLQTCLFDFDDQGVSVRERDAYLQLLSKIKSLVDIKGVLLYTLARPSLQPEVGRLKPLSSAAMHEFAAAIDALGCTVRISV